MAFVSPGTPNLADFLTFLAESVQIPSVALPASSPWPGYAFDQAMGLVLNPPCGISPGVLYTLAVYNCATHLLLMITPDQPNQSFLRTSAATTAARFRRASASTLRRRASSFPRSTRAPGRR